MNHFQPSNNTHDQLAFFFKLWKMLVTGDNPPDFTVDSISKQLLMSEKQKTSKFFENIIDQPAFMSDDHKRLRKLMVDWYASNRSMVTRAVNSTDPFSLDNEGLNEVIKSFGFPYPDRLITKTNKSLFLLDLINLYNKKGTPDALARALQYFGLQNIRLSEWWIERTKDGIFVARSQPIIPRVKKNSPDVQYIPYKEFVENDPHWYLSEDDLKLAYSNSEITLPSITPHISIDASLNISGIYPAIAILTKKMQESYDHWVNGGQLYSDIVVGRYGLEISFLELALALTYIFSSETSSDGLFFYQYQNSLDENGDNIDDVNYDIVIDEYNDITQRPKTREERDIKLAQLKNNFVGTASEFFLQDPSDVAVLLDLINPTLKTSIDADIAAQQREAALEELMLVLDGFVEQTLAISEFSLGYLIFGSSTYERLKPIIDFFKPFRARIRELLTAFMIDEPLQHSVLLSDNWFQTIEHTHKWDNLIASDLLELSQIIQWLPEVLNITDDWTENIGQMVIDEITPSGLMILAIDQNLQETIELTEDISFDLYEGFSDSLTDLDGGIKEDYLLNIEQTESDNISTDDNMNFINMAMQFNENSSRFIDSGLTYELLNVEVYDASDGTLIEQSEWYSNP